MSKDVPVGYKLTEVGVIPEDWEAKTIGEVVTFSGGSQPSRSTFIFKYREGYIRLIQIRDYKTDDFTTYIPKDLARKCCSVDDVMIGRYGPPIFQILRGIEGAYNVALIKSVLSQKVDLNYWYYYVQQERLFSLIEGLSQRSSGQTGIDMPSLKAFRFPLPSLREQEAISRVLSDTDALITSLDKLIAKKRDIKQAAMQQLLTGKQRLEGFGDSSGKFKQTEIGLIPEDWEVKSLGDIGEALIGLTYNPSNVKESGLLVLRSSNVFEGRLAFENNVYVDVNVPDKLRTQKGDILICVRNGSRDLIGKCALIDERAVGETFGAFMTVFRTQFSSYVFLQFQSNLIKKQIHEHIGATINQITNKNLNSFKIPLPACTKEQQAIAKVLSDMDSEISALEQRRDKTKALKQAMMQELLTGRIRLL